MTSDMANKMQDYEATGDVAMNRAASTMRDTTEPLREKAKEAMEKSRSSGEEMMQASRATGERLASDVHDKGSELLDKARGTGQQLMESTEDAASYAKDKVKQGKESAESTGKGMANIATDKVRQGADAASRKANDMAGAAKTTMATDTTNMTTTTNGMQYTPAPDTILLEVKTDGRPLVVDGKARQCHAYDCEDFCRQREDGTNWHQCQVCLRQEGLVGPSSVPLYTSGSKKNIFNTHSVSIV